MLITVSVPRELTKCAIPPSPAKQVLWIVEQLWNSFKGTINSKGYKVLHQNVGVIYGDSLTEEQIKECLQLLKDNGFAASACVYGCGGYLLQKLNRDTQRFAFKSSAQKRNGVWYDVFKQPSDVTKASKKGLLKLILNENKVYRTVNVNDPGDNQFHTVYENGQLLIDQNFKDVKLRAKYECK